LFAAAGSAFAGVHRMRLHKSVTLERVTDAVERRRQGLDDPGFCICCGAEAEGVEPDACKYECDACGKSDVYGAEELLVIMI
jgi:hypothetical protein